MCAMNCKKVVYSRDLSCGMGELFY